jgi:ribosome-associated translation inhibitor RaiA
MNLTVLNSSLSPALTRYTEVRTWLALQKISHRVAWLTVWLRDSSDQRAGGKICQMEAWVRGIGLVVAEHQHADPTVAVEVAVSRMKQAILRRVKKRWQAPRREKARFREAAYENALVTA